MRHPRGHAWSCPCRPRDDDWMTQEKRDLELLSRDTGLPAAVLLDLRRRDYAVVELDDEADQR